MEDGRKHRLFRDHYGLMSSPRGMTGKVIALLFISLAAHPQTAADIGGAAHEVLANTACPATARRRRRGSIFEIARRCCAGAFADRPWL